MDELLCESAAIFPLFSTFFSSAKYTKVFKKEIVMKKVVSVILTLCLLCTALPMSALAFDQYTVYLGQSGCRLTSLSFTQANNAWLAWNVTFGKHCDDRVWETEKDHPNIVGRTVIPTFTY